MKKTVLTLAMMAIIAGTISTIYGQEPDKNTDKSSNNLQETQKSIVDVKQDLKENQTYSISLYHRFIRDSEIKIRSNKRSLADFKVMLSKINQKDKAQYYDKVNGLELKNDNLKNMLTNYKKDKSHYKWISFKSEFNHDMDQLETVMWGMN